MESKLKQAAFSAFVLLMQPIARMLLRCGVTWKELAELTKLVYVKVATEDYGKHGRPANASRVAILTGLSRREVKRARDLLATHDDEKLGTLEKINHASRVLSGWFHDPDFLDARGRPRLLGVEGDRGFAALAKRYAPDIPGTAMLKELKATGAVRTTPAGRLRAAMRYYQPAAAEQDAVLRAGSVLKDLGATVAHNLSAADRATRFEGRATNAHVERGMRRAFREFVERRAMAFLEDVDRWLTDHEAKPAGEKTDRLGVGVYLVQDD